MRFPIKVAIVLGALCAAPGVPHSQTTTDPAAPALDATAQVTDTTTRTPDAAVPQPDISAPKLACSEAFKIYESAAGGAQMSMPPVPRGAVTSPPRFERSLVITS